MEIGERHDGERIEDIDVFRARLRDAGAIVIDPSRSMSYASKRTPNGRS